MSHLLSSGLLAASMRYPRQLASRVALQPQGPWAYDVVWGTDTIRILVLREMPEAEQNLVWNLFRIKNLLTSTIGLFGTPVHW